MSTELDESIIFHCDKWVFEIEEEDAIETHVKLYHVNQCQMCSINFANECELKEHNEVNHIKFPQKQRNIPLK